MTPPFSTIQPDRGNSSTGPVELRWQIWLPWSALALILLSATGTDPDLWGHVRFGLDFLHTRALPSIDPYSFTQDKPWVNHEWLSEALMAAAFALRGTTGLVILKTLVMACTVSVVWRRLHGASPVVCTAMTTLAIVGALPLSGTVRPQIWSALGLALLVPLLDEKPPSLRRIIWGGVLFAAWANLHGGWITGGAALATHVAIRTARAPKELTAWLVLGTAALAGTLLNPYGVGLWRFLAATVRSSRPDISEWAAFGLHEPAIMWVSVAAPMTIMALLVRRRETRPPAETCVVVLLLVGAGLRVSRVAPLMCPAALALLAPSIARAWGARAALTAPSAPAAMLMLLPAAMSFFAVRAPLTQALTCLPIDDAWAPDRSAAAQLRGLSGNLWTTFDWGEYAIWHFGPALRVSIDGRRETVYSDDLGAWNRAAENGEQRAVLRMLALRPHYIWLPLGRLPVLSGLIDRDYRVDLETGTSFIATRRDLPRVASRMAPLPGCFP
jgi:hypothetical protein